MRDFHMDYATANRFPLIRAFSLAAWNNETNAWCAMERVSDGYLIQELHRSQQAS